MKRYQAIAIAAAAIIGCSYVGTVGASSTAQRVALNCDTHTMIIEHNAMQFAGYHFIDGVVVIDTKDVARMEFKTVDGSRRAHLTITKQGADSIGIVGIYDQSNHLVYEATCAYEF